jgi:Ca2+:H+ antiporter
MKKAPSNQGSNLDRIRSWTRTTLHGHPTSADSNPTTFPISNHDDHHDESTNLPPFASSDLANPVLPISKSTSNHGRINTTSDTASPTSSTQVEGEGTVLNTDKQNVAIRFYVVAKSILFSSYINLLLVFVPIGIASHVAHLNAGITFGMNAVAIIPLAGLLSYATESVAHRMGDTIGALMNVSFGNAVELIIFMYVSLTRDQGKKVREALLKALSYQSRPISISSSYPAA